MPALFVVEFLHRVFDVYKSYFGEVTPSSLTSNFSAAYQLLEEMLDNGYPMISEPNALQTLIAPPTLSGNMSAFFTGKSAVSDTIGEGAMSIIPWRRAGVSYTQNEIFFDICEEIDCIVERCVQESACSRECSRARSRRPRPRLSDPSPLPRSNGTIVTNDVRGTISCACRLSGVPDLTLSFINPAIIEDASFHPCVRYGRYEREAVVSFVPPDGNFTLMSYRVVDRNPSAPIYCRPAVQWRDGGGRASFTIGAKPMGKGVTGGSSTLSSTRTGGMGNTPASNAAAAAASANETAVDDVRLVVTFPRAVKSVSLTADIGSVNVDPRTNELTWHIGRLPSGRTPELTGTLHLQPGAPQPLEAVSATLAFSVAGLTVSGLAVKDLTLNEKYKFAKGVKTQMRTGKYQVRT